MVGVSNFVDKKMGFKSLVESSKLWHGWLDALQYDFCLSKTILWQGTLWDCSV